MEVQNKTNNLQKNNSMFAIFSVMIMTNIIVNLDHGILPACTINIQQELGMDEFELGLFGSTVYIGISIMGLFAGRLYQLFDSKILTIFSLILLEASLALFVLSQDKTIVYLSRFLTGGSQVFLIVYYPVWADKHGGNKKTMWITLIQICIPIGIFAGYAMTAIILATGHHYKLSFYIQIVIVAVLIIAFSLFDRKDLSSRRKINEGQNSSGVNQESICDSQRSQHPEESKEYTVSQMFCHLMRSKMYLVGTFDMAITFYVSTGAQFWLTKYFIDVLGVQEKTVLLAFAIVSVSGPTSGVVFGGYIISKNGGYDHPYAIYYVFIFSVITVTSGFILLCLENFVACCIILWLVFFFGGAIIPGLTGITMASVSPYLRPFGNSTSESIKNIFGCIPSPFIYGMLNHYLGKRAGLQGLVIWSLWAPILCGLGCWHKYSQTQRLKENENSAFHEEQAYSDLQGSQNGDGEIREYPILQVKQILQTKDAYEIQTPKHS